MYNQKATLYILDIISDIIVFIALLINNIIFYTCCVNRLSHPYWRSTLHKPRNLILIERHILISFETERKENSYVTRY